MTKNNFLSSIILLCCIVSRLNATHNNTIFVDHEIAVASLPTSSSTTFQLYSHGRSGELLINGKWMNAAEIAAFLEPKISHLTSHISHLNVYGCEFAKGEKGLQAVAYLQKELGVSVAASTNITGIDGDWNLEVGTNRDVLTLNSFTGNLQCTGVTNLITADNNGTFGTLSGTNTSTVATATEYSVGNAGAGNYRVINQGYFATFSGGYWGTNTSKIGNTTGTATDAYLIYSDNTTAGKIVYNTTFTTTVNTTYNFSFDFASAVTGVANYNAQAKVEIVNSSGTVVATVTSVEKLSSGTSTTYSTASGSVMLSPGTYTYRIKNVTTSGGGMIDNVKVTYDCLKATSESGIVNNIAGGTAIANVASNDIVNGTQATLGSSGNARIAQLGTWPAGITLDTLTGAINVAPNTSAGSYNLTYNLCDKTTGACVNTTDIVNVGGAATACGGYKFLMGVFDDYDGDLVCNYQDLDNDNDGILDSLEQVVCPVNCTLDPAFSYVDLNVSGATSSTITGSLTTNGGTTNVTFTRSATNTLSNDGQPNTTYKWYPLAAYDGWGRSEEWCPINNLTANGWISANAAGTVTAKFTKPVKDPRISFGSPNNGTAFTFPTKVRVVTANAAAIAAGVVVGSFVTSLPAFTTEISVTVEYKGVYDSISFNDGGVKEQGWYEFNVVTDLVLPTGTKSYVDTDNCKKDTDGDGITDDFDLDSDGDGCTDAIEGGATLTSANLVTTTINGGNSGPSYTGSVTTPVNQNLCFSSSCVNANGVPTSAGSGQTVGTSTNKNALDAQGKCCKSGYVNPGITLDTVKNACPATTVNLTTLAKTTATPTGTTFVLSTHNPPTSAGDTLTTAQKTAYATTGKVYGMFYDKAADCYSPADSVYVKISICCYAGTSNPAITLDTIESVCPAVNVNLSTLAKSTATPSGTTFVLSTHNPPTSAGDTLTTAQAATYATKGKVYGMFYDKLSNCYSPADSIYVSIICCAGKNSPIITPTFLRNSCPASSINISTLTNSGTAPVGSTMIWSLHNPPTSAADTLTVAEQTAFTQNGVNVYALFYDKLGNCYSPADSLLAVVLVCPTPDTVISTKPACPTCPVTVCTVGDEATSTDSVVYSSCPTPAGYTKTGPDASGCYVYTPSASVTTELTTCQIKCSGKAPYTICDTTIVIIPKPVTPDSVTKTPACPTCPVTACKVANDTPSSGAPSTTTLCGTPTGYTAVGPDANGCVTYTPDGTVTTNEKACMVTCKGTPAVCDTTYVILNKPITPDSTVKRPACPTCPISICPIVNDVPPIGKMTYSSCGMVPSTAGTTVINRDGCMIFQGNGSQGTDTIKTCIVTCNAAGKCDTTYIKIAPAVPPYGVDSIYKQAKCSTCPTDTICATKDDIPTGYINFTHTFCTETPTGQGTFTSMSSTGCAFFTPNGTQIKDTIKACVMTCADTFEYISDSIGAVGSITAIPNMLIFKATGGGFDTFKVFQKFTVCDTTRMFFTPPPTPDYDTAQAACPSCSFTKCPIGDDLTVTTGSTFSNCGPVPGYTMGTPDQFGCIKYTADPATVSLTTPQNTCLVVCNGNICDTTYLHILPPVSPDTIVDTPSCSSCPTTICAVKDDVKSGTLDSVKTCGPPTGYSQVIDTATGCVTYTPTTQPTGPVKTCIVACKNGVCDTTYTTISPKLVTPDTNRITPTCATCPVTSCYPTGNDIDTIGGGTTFKSCGAPAGYSESIDSTTGCVTYTPNAQPTGPVTGCMIVCKNGVCDTLRTIIDAKPLKADTVSKTPTCSSCPIETCYGADAATKDMPATGVSYKSCGAPAGYTESIDTATGCVKYTPSQNNTDTAYGCMIVCKNGVCDTIRTKIVPKPITPDTNRITPTCATCPVTSCYPTGNDIDTIGGGTTFKSCGAPAGYSESIDSTTGCVTYTPNAQPTGPVTGCMIVCKNGVCDTLRTIIDAKPLKADTVSKTPTCSSCPIETCYGADAATKDMPATGVSYKSCGAPAGYTESIDTATGCVKYTPSQNNTDTAFGCMIVCKNGVCDTIRTKIVPKPISPDTNRITPTCATCPVTSCYPTGNDIDTIGGGATFKSCGAPAGYSESIDSTTGCVTYTPNAQPTGPVTGCMIVCKNGVCDTLRTIIDAKPLKADTVSKTPTCSSCPIETCYGADAATKDMPATGVSYKSCGAPAGYTESIDTATGCVKYTPSQNNTDTAYGCMIVCKNGVCDTIRTKIVPKPITPDTNRITPTCATCPVTSCYPTGNDIDTVGGGTTFKSCGAPVGYSESIDSTTGCVTYTPNAQPTGPVTGCMIVCKNGVCDTLRTIIDAKPLKADTVSKTPTCSSCPIETCYGADAATKDMPATGVSYKSCGAPAGYTESIDTATGCVKYTPSQNNTDTAYGCMIVCKNGVCDTIRTKIVPKPITPDTNRITPTCATCPVTSCYPTGNDIDTIGGGTTFKSCGAPAGYSESIDSTTGCVTYTPNAQPTGPVTGCMIVCKNGVCDTLRTIIDAKPLKADTVSKTPTCSSCPIETCYGADAATKDMPATGVSYKSCGAPAGYTESIDTATGCVKYTPSQNNTDTAYGCMIVCKNGMCDTIRTMILPKPVIADTNKITPTCATCPVTSCYPSGNDIDTAGMPKTTYSSCGAPAGYDELIDTLTGCVTYTPNGQPMGPVTGCMVICKNGVCDTLRTIIDAKPLKADTVAKTPSCASCPVETCYGADAVTKDMPSSGVTYSSCGAPAGFDEKIDALTGCVTYTANTIHAKDTAYGCMIVCKNGMCDTIRTMILPKPVIADTNKITPTCATCPVTSCYPSGNDIDTAGMPKTTYSSCGAPAGYDELIDTLTGCVTYTPNAQPMGPVTGCVLVCKNGVCDTLRTIIDAKPLKADTVAKTPSCASCPVETCYGADAVTKDMPSSGVTYSSCGAPAGFDEKIDALTGCVTYTANTIHAKDTAYGCMIVCKNGMCDTIRTMILPKPVIADTNKITPTCATCPVTSCYPSGNDIDTAGMPKTTYSSCGAPAGYDELIDTLTGCVTYTPNGQPMGPVTGCMVICKNGVCDTLRTIIDAKPLKADTVAKTPSCASCPVETCYGADAVTKDMPSSGVTYSSCGAPAGFDEKIDALTGCVTYTANTIHAKDTAYGCMIVCKNGMCDTIRTMILPKPVIADTNKITPTCATCPVTSCYPSGNDIDTAGMPKTTYSSCGAPAGYDELIDTLTGCVTYTPNGQPMGPVTGCMVICKNGVCDTLRTIIDAKPLKADTVAKTPSCASCPVETCYGADAVTKDMPSSGVTYSSCGAPAGFDEKIDALTGCVTYTANTIHAKDTAYGCMIVCKNGMCDTIRTMILPKPVIADTNKITPTCATCPVTSCYPSGNDIDTAGMPKTTYSSCGAPAGYDELIDTLTGCVTYTPNGQPMGPVTGCMVICKNGVCDTLRTIIDAKPLKADTVAKTPSCASCPVETCYGADAVTKDMPSSGVTYSSCGAPAGFDEKIDALTGCVTYTANTIHAKDTAYGCMIVCKNGMCDTIRTMILPKPVIADTNKITPTCATCPVTSCYPSGNDIDTAGMPKTTYSSCGAPAGYDELIDTLTGCVTYTPNAQPMGPVTGCVLVCKNGVCDTLRTIIDAKPLKADTITKVPACASCPVKLCYGADALTKDMPDTAVKYSSCGAPNNYTEKIDTATGCVTYTPNAINATDTVYGCMLVCKNGMCDTIRTKIPPMPIKADTNSITPSCPTCPVTSCYSTAKTKDVDTTGGKTTYSSCGVPTGYTESIDTISGCATYTPLVNQNDTVYSCMLVCKNGVCDTLRTMILPKRMVVDTVSIKAPCASCPITTCYATAPTSSDLPSAAAKTYSSCGAPDGYSETIDTLTGCVTYQATKNPTVPVMGCMVVCVGSICDTVRFVINPNKVIADTNKVTAKCNGCPVTSCYPFNDIAVNSKGITYSSCGVPDGYKEEMDTITGCVKYTPTRKHTDTVKGCMVICYNGVCDTLYTIIYPKAIITDSVVAKLNGNRDRAVVCPTGDDVDLTIATPVYSSCSSGGNNYTIVGPDVNGCFTYSITDSTKKIKDTQVFCTVVCVNGICDTTYVVLLPPIQPTYILPNYFSPNGDGSNDYWNLDVLKDKFPNARVTVYNRWGNVVWRSLGPYGTDGVNVWYGQLEGSQELVPDGTYYYLLELEDEFGSTKTGFIEIMRQ